jgi:hypothetical protein
MDRAILLLPLQGHEACNRVNFTLLYIAKSAVAYCWFIVLKRHVCASDFDRGQIQFSQ